MIAELPRCPEGPGWALGWGQLLEAHPWLGALEGCPQDPIYHGEGDVLIHTRMVCQELVQDPAWRALEEEARQILFAAALLHDVAKPQCTVHEGERVRSPNHARLGDRMAREILWLAGAHPRHREQVAALVRYHQMPYLFLLRPDPEGLVRKMSLKLRCDWLAILARADLRGRICPDKDAQLENVDLFVLQAQELGCLRQPYPFASDHSRFLYFRREDRDPDYEAWDDTRLGVVVMSGLPGSGKDHWLRTQRPELPVVSLDGIRRELGARPTGNQGAVVQLARERAREYLRRGQSFAWNATNLTQSLRAKTLNLLADYSARITLVCVDPPAQTLLRQNRDREAVVPPQVIRKMVKGWEFPDLSEAHEILWVTGRQGPEA